MPAKLLHVPVPIDIFAALNESESQLSADMKLFADIKYFQAKKLTLGKASQLAGLSRHEFENTLARHDISISSLSIADVETDIEKLALI